MLFADDIAQWAKAEIETWIGFAGAFENRSGTTFTFHIRRGIVGCDHSSGGVPQVLLARIAQHALFLQQAVAALGYDRDVSLLIDVGDGAEERAFPVFSFQKRIGSSVILLPDAVVDPAPTSPSIGPMTKSVFAHRSWALPAAVGISPPQTSMPRLASQRRWHSETILT